MLYTANVLLSHAYIFSHIMKPHLPSSLRRSLLAAIAITSLSPIAKADLTLDSSNTIVITYSVESSIPSVDGTLKLTGGTKLDLNDCGIGDGKTYIIFTGVTELVDANGNTISGNASSHYFDTTQPGTGFWSGSSLVLNGNVLQLELHDKEVKEAVTITERRTEPIYYQYYADIIFSNIEETASSRVLGGAVNLPSDSNSEISHNGSVAFIQNTAYEGGAIYADNNSSVSLNNNGSLEFIENKATALVSYGGGISAMKNCAITLDNNGGVRFISNSSDYEGGAIYVKNDSNITLSDNGSIEFIGNTSNF